MAEIKINQQKHAPKKIYFLGLISNVDKSILKLKLKYGFKVVSMKRVDVENLLLELGIVKNQMDAFMFFGRHSISHKEEVIYIIKNEYERGVKEISSRDLPLVPGEIGQKYLMKAFTKLRLLSEGNICLATYFTYSKCGGNFFLHMSMTQTDFVKAGAYSLKGIAQKRVSAFLAGELSENKLVKLAHDNYELSYTVGPGKVAFLLCMISLELLFNSAGNSEISYRISRNCAVLLSKDKSEGRKIFKEVKELYSKRSKLVHSGDASKLSKEDVHRVREYVRRSIMTLLEVSDVEKLVNTFVECGFGDFRGKSVTY